MSKVRKADPDVAIIEASADPAPQRARGEIHQVTVQVRGANGNDPGEVALAWFVFDGGRVALTTENGDFVATPIDCPLGRDPRSVARAAAWQHLQGESHFNRRITYPNYGTV